MIKKALIARLIARERFDTRQSTVGSPKASTPVVKDAGVLLDQLT
jgi:hypothetical protein